MKNQYKTIIIADHEETDLELAQDALDDLYRVFTVPSGKTLFLLLESVEPDLILLDIEMPDMDGREIIDILKSSEKTAHVPVILLSARTDTGSEKKGPGAGAGAGAGTGAGAGAGTSGGAANCLAKPLTRKLLIKQIEKQLRIGSQKKEG